MKNRMMARIRAASLNDAAFVPAICAAVLLGAVLVFAVPSVPAYAAAEGILVSGAFGQEKTEASSPESDTYVNSVQGYSVHFQGDLYGVEEFNGGEGQTTFYLLDSAGASAAGRGSRYTVSYRADWDGNPDADTYLGEVLFGAQMEYPDSFVQMSASPYEILYAGPAPLPSVMWAHYDADAGQDMLELRAMGIIEGGGCVFLGASMFKDEIEIIAEGLGQAVGSFRIHPYADGGTSVTWADMETPAAQTASPEEIPYEDYITLHYTPIQETDGYSYYLTVPQEWAFIEYGGWGESQLLDTFNYYHPEIRMTFWGLQEIPGSALAAQLAGVPFIMQDGSVTSFLQLLPQIGMLADRNGQLPMPDETRVLSVEIQSVTPVYAVTNALMQNGMAGLITDEAIVETRMILDDGYNTEVTALIYATVACNGIGDFVSYSVMNVYGIFAPDDMFGEVARTLVENGCGEFTLHEHYMQMNPESRYDLVIYEASYQQWKNYILSNY